MDVIQMIGIWSGGLFIGIAIGIQIGKSMKNQF